MNGEEGGASPATEWSLAAMALALRRGEMSSEALVEAHLARIAATDEALGAFVTVAHDAARRQAQERDRARRNGSVRGYLDGLPFAAKDVFLTRGLRTTAGSPMLAEWVPEQTAEAIRRLEAGGAVLIGKTNTHEFAFGVTTQTCFASTRNPHGKDRIAGGSSGGSAAAVAAGMAPLALGTDTAGSIRLPAAWCGVVGFKPSYGRVDPGGVVAQSYSSDHVGPIVRNAADAALVMEVLADTPRPDYLRAMIRPPSLSELIVGLPEPRPEGAVAAEVEAQIEAKVAQIRKAGGRVVPIELPLFALAPQINSDIILAETAARHEEYREQWFEQRPIRYGADVAELLEKGRGIPATAFVRASQLRQQLKQQAEMALKFCPILATPTVPLAAPLMGAREVEISGQREELLPAAIRFLSAYSLAGLPAVSIPIGKTASGLPIGWQLIAGRHNEPYLLAVAARLLEEEDEIVSLAELMALRDGRAW